MADFKPYGPAEFGREFRQAFSPLAQASINAIAKTREFEAQQRMMGMRGAAMERAYGQLDPEFTEGMDVGGMAGLGLGGQIPGLYGAYERQQAVGRARIQEKEELDQIIARDTAIVDRISQFNSGYAESLINTNAIGTDLSGMDLSKIPEIEGEGKNPWKLPEPPPTALKEARRKKIEAETKKIRTEEEEPEPDKIMDRGKERTVFEIVKEIDKLLNVKKDEYGFPSGIPPTELDRVRANELIQKLYENGYNRRGNKITAQEFPPPFQGSPLPPGYGTSTVTDEELRALWQ